MSNRELYFLTAGWMAGLLFACVTVWATTPEPAKDYSGVECYEGFCDE